MVPSRAAHDVMGGQLEVLHQFGAVPRRLVWDQEGCIGRRRGGVTTLTGEFSAFVGHAGDWAVILNAADPEAKGIVERNNHYYETSFLPGRSFADVADFNAQFTGWLRRANNRVHATTKVRPAEAVYEDRGSMLAFPPVLPDTAWRFATRLPRDHYVRVEHQRLLGQPPLRRPPRRGPRRPSTPSRDLRGHRGRRAPPLSGPPPGHPRPRSRPHPAPHASERLERPPIAELDEVEVRDLAVYDRAVGLG